MLRASWVFGSFGNEEVSMKRAGKKAVAVSREMDPVSRKCEFISRKGLYMKETLIGPVLAHPFERKFHTLDPDDLMIDRKELHRVRGWKFTWAEEVFKLKPQKVYLYDQHGSSSGDFFSLADVLRIEATQYWQAMKRAFDDVERLERDTREREYQEFQREREAHQRDLDCISGADISTPEGRHAKVQAWRNVANYLDGNPSVSSVDVERFLGLGKRGIEKAVSEGHLSRVRSTGWDYNVKRVQQYIRQLADDLESST
jgi:hypothetical protein